MMLFNSRPAGRLVAISLNAVLRRRSMGPWFDFPTVKIVKRFQSPFHYFLTLPHNQPLALMRLEASPRSDHA
jgi:hypothetical protein